MARVLIALALLGTLAFSVCAEGTNDVAKIIEAVRAHPHTQLRDSYGLLLVSRGRRKYDEMVFLAYTHSDPVFGLVAEVNVPAEESGQGREIECYTTFWDKQGKGVVSKSEWVCLAWTPIIQRFVEDNKQRIYHELISEAKKLLKIK